nr:hypothetical protein [uncultured Clostridium sp.]
MSKLEQYIDYINEHILPFIDYEALDRSYQTVEKEYAKGILNLLHTAMLEQYGDTQLICGHGDMQEKYAVLPGIIQSKKSGEIAIALLGIDLLSSGEHRQTEFLCKYGVISQGHNDLPKALSDEFTARYFPYDYCYTADIPGDIHVSKYRLPAGIKDILQTFHEHTASLLPNKNRENETDMER